MNLAIIQKELDSSVERLRNRRKIKKRIQVVEDNLAKLYARQTKLDKIVATEKKEYKRLEKKSVAALFHTLSKNREEKLEKEREEYLQAVLKFNECLKDIELQEYELSILKRKLVDTVDIENKIEQLLEKKEYSLLRSQHPYRDKLISILKKIDAHQDYQKDIGESKYIAQNLLKLFKNIQYHLHKALNWNNVKYHRGRPNKHSKYNHIDKAQDLLHTTKRNLQLFQTQLEDIYQDHEVDFSIELPSFTGFSDMFINNLISDWIFQAKVKKTADMVLTLNRKVKTYKKSLNQLQKETVQKLADLETAKRHLLMKPSD